MTIYINYMFNFNKNKPQFFKIIYLKHVPKVITTCIMPTPHLTPKFINKNMYTPYLKNKYV
jgi:hypothetical protein